MIDERDDFCYNIDFIIGCVLLVVAFPLPLLYFVDSRLDIENSADQKLLLLFLFFKRTPMTLYTALYSYDRAEAPNRTLFLTGERTQRTFDINNKRTTTIKIQRLLLTTNRPLVWRRTRDNQNQSQIKLFNRPGRIKAGATNNNKKHQSSRCRKCFSTHNCPDENRKRGEANSINRNATSLSS